MLKYWERQWKLAKDNFSKRSPLGFFDGPSYWDSLASGYIEKTKDKELQRMFSEVSNFIIRNGLVTKKSRVLDIGCGAGTYTIPFAKVAKTVTALDPSKKMLDFIGKRAKQEGLSNIHTVTSIWNEGIASEMRKSFDFTIASFCPGIMDREAIIQMHNTSSCYCCIIGYYSTSNADFIKLCKDITGKTPERNIFEIAFPFNLLYEMCIPVNLKTLSWLYTYKISSSELCAALKGLFNRATRINVTKRRWIYDYVMERSRDGIFKERREFRIGLLWWESSSII